MKDFRQDMGIEQARGQNGPSRASGAMSAQEMHALLTNPVSRREFLTRLSAAGLGALTLPLVTGCGGGTTNSNGYSNAAFPGIVGRNINEVVLNYALTLEIVEADLYRQALNRASGRGLTQALDPKLPLSGGIGNYTLTLAIGGFSSAQANLAFLYLLQFAYMEATHRDYLTATLTGLGAPQAQANLKGYEFPNNEPGADLKTIITNLYNIEETGVRGYLGALTALSDNNVAQIMASIQSTEARHSTTFAYLLGKDPGPSQTVAASADLSVTGSPYPHADSFEYYSLPADVLTKLTATYYLK